VKLRPRYIAVVVSLIMSVTVALLAFYSRPNVAVTLTFAGYTNDQTGLYTFAIFRLSNHTRHIFACMQGPLEVKSQQGWLEDNEHTGFQHRPNLEPGKHMTITLLSPPTNKIWRANFVLHKMTIRPTWQLKIMGFRWQTTPNTYLIRSAEIGN